MQNIIRRKKYDLGKVNIENKVFVLGQKLKLMGVFKNSTLG